MALSADDQSSLSAPVCLARQPIFDRNLKVVAYELLHRESQLHKEAAVADDDEATNRVLLNTLVEIGFERVVGSQKAFVNFAPSFILNGHCAARDRPGFTVGDFLTSEVPRLEEVRDEWLEMPDPECQGRTRRSIIDRERARLPEGMSGQDAIIDPDCPCCQMAADMPGPMLWHLDTSEMDDDFAFDIHHRTREEWEEEQRQWEQQRKRFDAEWKERRRLGVTNSGFGEKGGDSVWSCSWSAEDASDEPLVVRLFGIGGHLAELIADVRGEAVGPSVALETQQFIDQLNRNFGNLREVLQTADPSLADAIAEPVIDRFVESLAAVASARPDLSAKCESLTHSLARFLEPHPAE